MLGILRQRTHVAGAHVEQMIGMRGRISDAAAGAGLAFDQGGAGPLMAEQVDRLKGTRKTAADDGDMIDRHVRWVPVQILLFR